MIAWAYIHSAAFERVKGVFADVDVMLIPCNMTHTQYLDDKYPSAATIKHKVFDRMIVIRDTDLPTVKDRCEDFGVKGFRWTEVRGERYREYAYTSQSGDIVFRIGHLRKQRRFEPTEVQTLDE